MRHPRIGKQTSLTIEATEEDSAAVVGNTNVDVVATTSLILFLEAVAAELIDDCCEAGEITVGSAVNVRHLAAAPIGARSRPPPRSRPCRAAASIFAVEAHHGRKT